MLKELTDEQILEILEKLPEETKEVLFSEKTAEYLYKICQKYGAAPEKVTEVARCAGQVLLGILPLEKFPEALEKEAGLNKNTAKSIADEIGLYIFSGLALGPKTPAAVAEGMPADEKGPKKPSAADVYREQIE